MIRGQEADGYPFLPRPYYLSFIAVAAYNRPNLDATGARHADWRVCP